MIRPVLLLSLAAISLGAPPVWPAQFSSNLTETIRLFNRFQVVKNPGAWFYDYAHRRMRFDHLEGQWDPLCIIQGLSPRQPHAPCHLIFSNDTSLYIHYPGAKKCCRACKGGGCTVLKPDWLKGAMDAGNKLVDGRTCRGWKVKGAFAEDYWYITQDGKPCQYYESYTLFGVIPVTDKSLTFDPNSYSDKAIPDAVFTVPSYCARPCRVSYQMARRKQWFYGQGFQASGL